MFVLVEAVFIFDFVEVVHVELSDERGVVFRFEVFRKQLEKLLVTFYDEGIAGVGPADGRRRMILVDHLHRQLQEVGRFLLAVLEVDFFNLWLHL